MFYVSTWRHPSWATSLNDVLSSISFFLIFLSFLVYSSFLSIAIQIFYLRFLYTLCFACFLSFSIFTSSISLQWSTRFILRFLFISFILRPFSALSFQFLTSPSHSTAISLIPRCFALSFLFDHVFCSPAHLIHSKILLILSSYFCMFLPKIAASVSVSAWTLVAISCERYYAIVHPLKSRRWQTLSHAYKLIALIWCGSLICMSPIAIVSRLIPTSQGKQQNVVSDKRQLGYITQIDFGFSIHLLLFLCYFNRIWVL